ncbi:unnamed protein product [Cuscuta epithymum]|uniref:Leucine-rich repeat-containing N-terminal plant-type domain-containing protein n=1 Tax=Cuscuta epithymum TaxID=186058 RepID=A0AAV0BXP9_9ASTE|nr:unnamed protein product [Cuscuta epithymum]
MGGRLVLLGSSTEAAAIALGMSCLLVVAMSGAAASKCFDAEREVLLKFKNSVLDEEGNLSSWGNSSDEDCCRDWYGVGCDDATGHVIDIDLSNMYLSAKDGGKYGTSLPFFELRYLKYLDLNDNRHLLANQSISSLIGNNYNGSSMVSLEQLGLRGTGIVGSIPENFGNIMPALTDLDLCDNGLQGFIPESLANGMPALTFLSLCANNLEGNIPENFGNGMPALTFLDLGFNELHGSIPENFGKNLRALTHLDLGENQLEGHIPEAIGNMSVLEYLDLRGNRLEGEIPKSLWNICSLRSLALNSNRLNGSLFITTICPYHPLGGLSLHGNPFTGLFPNITTFPSLGSLFFSNTLIDGVISEHHFANLSNLSYLDLSSNTFTFNVSSTWLPLNLEQIHLSSCRLGPEFPTWLRTQTNCKVLDISNNAISDSIPTWFWNTFTHFMNINVSNNRIKGIIGIGAQASLLGGRIDMHSNQLEGVIPPTFFNVGALHLSGNKFTDLNYLCDLKVFSPLRLLDISFNNLSGTLPNCWSRFPRLQVLNLGKNHNLSGTLPTSIGSLTSLEALHLDHNKFTGALPSSMKNCSRLISLHLGHNNLFGPIPDWVGESITQLSILVLRSNNFNASVPTTRCRLQSLQLLDLSLNHLSGTIPKCLSNLTQMMNVTKGIPTISYELSFTLTIFNQTWYKDTIEDDKIEITWKGAVFEFGSRLRDVKSIDLSSNMLSGEIPTEITLLVALVSLNLSHNNLRGQIPPRIGNLSQLEFLDLSSNHLSGSIPQSLALIHGIGVLNLSDNYLS